MDSIEPVEPVLDHTVPPARDPGTPFIMSLYSLMLSMEGSVVTITPEEGDSYGALIVKVTEDYAHLKVTEEPDTES